jgi:hypothetical protein
MRQRKGAMSDKEFEKIVSSHIATKGDEVTKKEQQKNMMRDLQEKGPTYVFIGLCVAVVLLTIGGSFHEEPAEDQSHYSTLGIKRMCKPDEIKIAHDKLIKELSGDSLEEVKEAFKVLSNPRQRRTYDRATPATREELYYKPGAIQYIAKGDGGLQWSSVANGKRPYLVEVHSGAARTPRHASILATPPNWGRLMTKTSKMLRSQVKLARINVDAEPELAAELNLLGSNMPKLPYLLAVTGPDPATCGPASDPKIGATGGCRAYKGEPRILKIGDFVGEGISMGSTEAVTYGTVENWKKESPDLVKVLLFRKSFTAMVLSFREAADELDGYGFKFGEVDVRSRGAVNLWRRFNLRRLPLIAVLRDDDKESPVYGGQLGTKTLENWLMINKNPSLPRVSSDDFEEKCIGGAHRFCAILGVDATGVAYSRINQTLQVFMNAQKMIEKHPMASQVHFMWADKIAEHLNSTEIWKSLTTVFDIKDADRKSENFVVTDNSAGIFKSFGGNLAKVTDLTDKDEEMKEFITGFIEGKAARTQKLPNPIFSAPPPPPYTQEDITKIFVVLIICSAFISALIWSYMTFKKEESIREEMLADSGKKRKKEKRDGEYGLGDD